MKRIGILTAGGDTPALNATIYGAVERANALSIEVLGIAKGFGGMLDPSVPHVRLNPLFTTIPELDLCQGGTLLGASRTYIDAEDTKTLKKVTARLDRLGIVRAGLYRRRWHHQRHAATFRTFPLRAGAENHRQRFGPQLPRRAERVAP